MVPQAACWAFAATGAAAIGPKLSRLASAFR